MMHDENNVLTKGKLIIVRTFFKKKPKHASLYIQNEHRHGFELLNF